jgi:hypothetical protein
MDAFGKDSIPAVAAIGLLAYATSDIAHHALGHGAACLASGGRIVSLSSIFVDCSRTGTAIDLSGPFANLLIGLVALLVCRIAARAALPMRLFLVLVASFNLLWFAMQLVFSAITATDDWAWAMHELHITGPVRAGLIIVGALLYLATVRFTAAELSPLEGPPARVRTIVLTVWLTAGVFACATAALDHHPLAAVLRHAAPQSLANSIGLLFVPRLTAKMTGAATMEAPLTRSTLWVVAATIVAAVSIILLGPGVALPP